MTDDRDREHADRQGDEGSAVHRPPSSSSDLLDLVRSAEDDARLALRKRTPAVPLRLASSDAAATPEEFVDVGDEAIDAPPSLPPLRVATPAGAIAVGRISAPSAARQLAREDAARPLPPAIGITLLLVLVVVALVVFTR